MGLGESFVRERKVAFHKVPRAKYRDMSHHVAPCWLDSPRESTVALQSSEIDPSVGIVWLQLQGFHETVLTQRRVLSVGSDHAQIQ